MIQRFLILMFPLLMGSNMNLLAQDLIPTANPIMIIEDKDGSHTETDFSGSAPILAHFTSNVKNIGHYTPYYEWRFYYAGKEATPYLLRYDETVDFTFSTSGVSYIKLYVTFVNGMDT
ncbi:MAG: gliding motility-associated C-terminal domain-containing protein, partial [Bacteroidaceae bacterium]